MSFSDSSLKFLSLKGAMKDSHREKQTMQNMQIHKQEDSDREAYTRGETEAVTETERMKAERRVGEQSFDK